MPAMRRQGRRFSCPATRLDIRGAPPSGVAALQVNLGAMRFASKLAPTLASSLPHSRHKHPHRGHDPLLQRRASSHQPIG